MTSSPTLCSVNGTGLARVCWWRSAVCGGRCARRDVTCEVRDELLLRYLYGISGMVTRQLCLCRYRSYEFKATCGSFVLSFRGRRSSGVKRPISPWSRLFFSSSKSTRYKNGPWRRSPLCIDLGVVIACLIPPPISTTCRLTSPSPFHVLAHSRRRDYIPTHSIRLSLSCNHPDTDSIGRQQHPFAQLKAAAFDFWRLSSTLTSHHLICSPSPELSCLRVQPPSPRSP